MRNDVLNADKTQQPEMRRGEDIRKPELGLASLTCEMAEQNASEIGRAEKECAHEL